jgi:hypothetical protein
VGELVVDIGIRDTVEGIVEVVSSVGKFVVRFVGTFVGCIFRCPCDTVGRDVKASAGEPIGRRYGNMLFGAAVSGYEVGAAKEVGLFVSCSFDGTFVGFTEFGNIGIVVEGDIPGSNVVVVGTETKPKIGTLIGLFKGVCVVLVVNGGRPAGTAFKGTSIGTETGLDKDGTEIVIGSIVGDSADKLSTGSLVAILAGGVVIETGGLIPFDGVSIVTVGTIVVSTGCVIGVSTGDAIPIGPSIGRLVCKFMIGIVVIPCLMVGGIIELRSDVGIFVIGVRLGLAVLFNTGTVGGIVLVTGGVFVLLMIGTGTPGNNIGTRLFEFVAKGLFVFIDVIVGLFIDIDVGSFSLVAIGDAVGSI